MSFPHGRGLKALRVLKNLRLLRGAERVRERERLARFALLGPEALPLKMHRTRAVRASGR